MLKIALKIILLSIFVLQIVSSSPPLKDTSERNKRVQAKRRERYQLKKIGSDPSYFGGLEKMKNRYANMRSSPHLREKYQGMLQKSRIRSSSRRLTKKYGLTHGAMPGGKYDHQKYFGKMQEREKHRERAQELTTTSVLFAREHESLSQAVKRKADEHRQKAYKAHEDMWKIYKKGMMPDISSHPVHDQNGADMNFEEYDADHSIVRKIKTWRTDHPAEYSSFRQNLKERQRKAKHIGRLQSIMNKGSKIKSWSQHRQRSKGKIPKQAE